MKTDALFYELFQEFPEFFFELIGQTSEEAQYYRFTATEIKQTAFRLDGLFMPTRRDKPLYILEVQFQNDPQFY
jgi:predicted transposase/invertase (TIGR01784 family)